MTDFAGRRRRMLDQQIAARGINDPRVLTAMGEVPREVFIPATLAEFAYEDTPLPIGEGQTISQPYIVALMLEAAEIGPDDRVLDIGTGSGYGAALLSRMAAEVHTIERHADLAEAARERFERLGYDNIRTRTGDGTLGWPEAAPFDAIIVAAGAPEMPETLAHQLEIGGRLVMPVGHAATWQRLKCIQRIAHDEFDEEDLGTVAFVPLVGAHGWTEDGKPSGGPTALQAPPGRAEPPARTTVELIRDAAEPLPDPDDDRFGALFDRIGNKRVVLLGEATHGTSEFYRARARITGRLIREHGFTIVAVEADWPDAAQIDRYIRNRPSIGDGEPAFARFPTWMWRNREVADFVEGLRRHNEAVPDMSARVGFYGLDLYSLQGSIVAVLDYLDKVDPEAAAVARERYGCLTPWQRDPATYGRAALSSGYAMCEQAVIDMLRDLLDKRLTYVAGDPESWLDAQQNARLIAAAEQYYRVMYYGSRESWNLRDRHMFETLQVVLAARGPDARAVVWAHNSHIGNAAATEMGRYGEINIGHLCREAYGDAAALVGFGTDRGTVAAATDWDRPMEIKQVRPSHPDSYERLCTDSGVPRFLLDLSPDRHKSLVEDLRQARLERAIGVIYRPDSERMSHYFEASLPNQFDLYVWFDETTAVTPLPTRPVEGTADTYPFGV